MIPGGPDTSSRVREGVVFSIVRIYNRELERSATFRIKLSSPRPKAVRYKGRWKASNDLRDWPATLKLYIERAASKRQDNRHLS